MVTEYNKIIFDSGIEPAEKVDKNTMFTGSCIVSGFLDDTYNKYPEFTTQVIMEYSPWTPWFVEYLPSPLSENEGFKSYLLGTFYPADWYESYYSPMAYNYADMIMMTVPKPRYSAFEASSFDKIQSNVLSYVDEVQ